ncbi:MAG: ferritin-like domain-containing protein [Gemmatimonadales bacterium]|nr:ferritin-like domain-containing protein [Gemmatimonadales bacterium]
MKTSVILEALNLRPDELSLSRRNAVRGAGRFSTALALAAVPLGLGGSARKAFAASAGLSVTDVLNYALTLEYLEDEFYRKGLAASGLIPGEDRTVFETISAHETIHVAYLKNALGGDAVKKPEFDFTAGGKFPTFEDYGIFQALAQGFEDTGVRAYKGQFGNLQSNPSVLTAAATIHSVEARHASEVRRLRGQKGWITRSQTDVPALAAVYAGEGRTDQAGVSLLDASTVGNDRETLVNAITEAFDESLNRGDVLAIAGQFLA